MCRSSPSSRARRPTACSRANTRWPRARRGAGRSPSRIDHVLPNIAAAADRAGDDPVRHRHSRRGGAVLSRPRRAAAAGLLGPDARRRAELALCRAAARGLSGPRGRVSACSASTCSATACATRSIRNCGRAAECCSRSPTSTSICRRPGAASASCATSRSRSSERPVARRGRRIRLGQDDDSALALMGLLPDGAMVSRRDPLRGPRPRRPRRGRDAAAARRPHRDDLSGADDGAQSAASASASRSPSR